MPGRAIRIFLVDGTPNGLKTAEIGLSTCKALVASRSALVALSGREESRRTGVYVLVGTDPEIPGRTAVYVGEGDDVLARIAKHDQGKDFWDRVVIVVSKDENLTKAHVRYLEARLVGIAQSAKRCTVFNSTTPNGGRLPEADTAEMEDFLEHVQLLMSTLGIQAFESVLGPHGLNHQRSAATFRVTGGGYDATADLVDNEIVVRKGSVARKKEAPSLQASSRAVRKGLLASGVLKEGPDGYVFTQDYAFGSASGSAQAITGANINGRVVWRTADGTTFEEWEQQRVKTTR
ncbi:GIY-YIG nuclease family protein [Anaeromyxobacter sp. SG64]|uniref:GIY-YIG nuclease family protein n=1 Tax=Anaeromyxobacter sp. SG64 TaxID=2925409 RepID=UPI001F5AE61F|nr:GIY-YIG nuclease family protein [Anaeromyxobacter sp. SG64]